MKTMLKAAGTAVLACTLATGVRADDAAQQVQIIGKMSPTRGCFPNYPSAALRTGAQGTTVLAFHVDETGKVTGVEITQSSGPTREHRVLDQAAAAALARCPFVPAKDGEGKPFASVISVNYTWRLE